MVREITTHHGNPLNDNIIIVAADDRGAGGANCQYILTRPEYIEGDQCHVVELELKFQSGNSQDNINGISNESLLAVVEDRLSGFQSGHFACQENETALSYIQKAMTVLAGRVKSRKARGVSGQAVE